MQTVKSLLQAANATVPRISAGEAQRLVQERNAVVIDVRDAHEVAASGKIKGALNISRGMIEFRADPATPYYNAELRVDRPVILYCASGGRSALAGGALMDMGYQSVHNLGAFKDWVEAGGQVEPA